VAPKPAGSEERAGVRRRERERDHGTSERRERAGARRVERAEEDQRAQPGGKRGPHGASISLICTSPSAHNSSAALAKLGRPSTGAVYSRKHAPDGGRRPGRRAREIQAPRLRRPPRWVCSSTKTGCCARAALAAENAASGQRRVVRHDGAWSSTASHDQETPGATSGMIRHDHARSQI
jgi:hypothetical protein